MSYSRHTKDVTSHRLHPEVPEEPGQDVVSGSTFKLPVDPFHTQMTMQICRKLALLTSPVWKDHCGPQVFEDRQRVFVWDLHVIIFMYSITTLIPDSKFCKHRF